MITEAYRVLTLAGAEALLCLLCNRVSYHPQDIDFTYCAACHVWLDRVPSTYDPAVQGPYGQSATQEIP
jgi:hypothetical protein